MRFSDARSGLSLFVGMVALMVLGGCAGQETKDGGGLRATETPKAAKIEPEARNLFFQAERAFNAKNYELAARLYQNVKAKFPRGRAHMLSSYRLGTIFYYREEYGTASREFDYFLSRFPSSDLSFDVNYNQAAAEFQLGHFERAYQSLSRLKVADIQAQGPRRAEVVYNLVAQTASNLNRHGNAVSAYAAEMALPLEDASRTAVTDNIDKQLLQMSNRAELEKLQSEVEDSTTKGKINDRLQQLAMATPTGPEAGTLPPNAPTPPTTGPITGGPDNNLPQAGAAAGISTSPAPMTSSSSSDRLSIGVALPLSGRFATYGRRALDGILLAARVFRGDREADFKLFVEDTASNPAQAQQAVENLVNDHNVSAIIGPLNWKESLAAAEKSQQLGVLNLSLAAKEGISEKGAYLFQNALTPRIQIESLVSFVVREKKFRRFAILAPNDNFGKDLANEFWEAVEKFGGHVVAYQSYSPGEKDFQSKIKELAGIADTKYRKVEFAKMWEFQKDKKPRAGRGAKELRVELPPIVDFDAVFIPDAPKAVATIAGSLAYFDVSPVALLGTTEWNNEQLYKRGGKNVEGAYFPGGISNSTRSPKQRDFIRYYGDAFGTQPDLLATQAFEAMEIIAAVVKRSGSSDRNDIVNQLATLQNFETPLGAVSFDATRLAKRHVPIYSLEAGGAITEQ